MLLLNLKVRINDVELYDENTKTFFFETIDVSLEHSLFTMSLWEAKYKKPFLSDAKDHEKTQDELLDYIRMMVIGEISDAILDNLMQDHNGEVQEYITDSQTATTITERKKAKPNSEMVTSELVYYWMFSNQIPKECEHWHLNRLITLIRVFSAKNSEPEKMAPNEVAARNRALNAQRRAKSKSKG